MNSSAIAADPQLRVPLSVLSNGRYSVLLSPTGSGISLHDGFALTRWSPDPVRDADGVRLYLRDLDTGEYWSATCQPVPAPDAVDAVEWNGGVARFTRTYQGITVRLEVAVAADRDVEVRRLIIDNRDERPRRIEITSYAEVVLNAPAADAAHPAFSKLFVQTAFDEARQALLAWRRLRSPGDRSLWLAHRLLGEGTSSEHETDRARFLGRGRSPAAPLALAGRAPLSGTVGNVLDPVLALRRVIALAPGAQTAVTAVFAAAGDRLTLERLLDPLGDDAAVEAILAGAHGIDVDTESLGLPEPWRRGVRTDSEWTLQGPETRSSTTPPAAPSDGTSFESGFSADGSEYVMRVPCDASGARLPPLPWINVIANEVAGCFISERGAACTWAANSRENRITPWFNDPVTDPHGEAFFVRDDATGEFHALTPGPAPGRGTYEVSHGFGYTRFGFEDDTLAHELTVFVPRTDPVRIARVAVTNRTTAPRTASLFAYAQLVLGVDPTGSRGFVASSLDEATGALLARNPRRGEFSGRVAFACAVSASGEHHVCADRAAFLGLHGDAADPAALREPVLNGVTGLGLDPCAALQVVLPLAAGETAHCAFLLGEADEAGAARAVVHRYGDTEAVDEALAGVRAFWSELLGRIEVKTPVAELDCVINGWLAYQNLSCRMWGRTALYQSGGAFGFRDQLQDAAALLYLDPAITRAQILLHAAHQFVEGDVLHWWHPPLSKGMRTRFADDLLWLPYITAFYLASTGDASILDETARFLSAPLLEPGEDEVLLVPEEAGTSAGVFEHCCRSIDRSLTRGVHGLPLIGVGDWNDGMNRVGREGRGESVWLGFFLYDILHAFIPLCRERGEHARAERYREYHRALEQALNDGGWDGAWYRRAYYDDGAPLGAAQNDECRIDTIAQAWAVLSGAAPEARAERALDAMEEQLVSEDESIIRLLTPAFDRTPHDPGYIKGYLPGVRENGGQYTHGALWGVRALAEIGRCQRAARLLAMLSPASHARTPRAVETYKVEPYVVAADVYGVEPHVGRGGWTWYTGSAGWMYRVALESVLGFTLHRGDEIRLQPCIPGAWPGFTLSYRLPDGATTYVIDVVHAGADAATHATLDDERLQVRERAVVIPLLRDGRTHEVRVRLGPDVGPRYAPRPA